MHFQRRKDTFIEAIIDQLEREILDKSTKLASHVMWNTERRLAYQIINSLWLLCSARATRIWWWVNFITVYISQIYPSAVLNAGFLYTNKYDPFTINVSALYINSFPPFIVRKHHQARLMKNIVRVSKRKRCFQGYHEFLTMVYLISP